MKTVHDLIHRLAYLIHCHEIGDMWDHHDKCYQMALTYFWTIGKKVTDEEIEALIIVATSMANGEKSKTFGKLDIHNYRFE